MGATKNENKKNQLNCLTGRKNKQKHGRRSSHNETKTKRMCEALKTSKVRVFKVAKEFLNLSHLFFGCLLKYLSSKSLNQNDFVSKTEEKRSKTKEHCRKIQYNSQKTRHGSCNNDSYYKH